MHEEKLLAIWGMNGHFYDAIMMATPQWVWTDDEWRDFLFSQIGL